MGAWYNDRDGGSNGGHVDSDYPPDCIPDDSTLAT